MPFPLQTPEHPLSPTQELWDSILQGLRDNRPAFVTESLPGVFAMHAGNQVHPKTLEYYEQIVSEAHGVAIEKTVAIFTQASDKQLSKLAESAEMIPILALHGDSDQGMPLEASATIVKEMLPWADLRVYKNAGHGMSKSSLLPFAIPPRLFMLTTPCRFILNSRPTSNRRSGQIRRRHLRLE